MATDLMNDPITKGVGNIAQSLGSSVWGAMKDIFIPPTAPQSNQRPIPGFAPQKETAYEGSWSGHPFVPQDDPNTSSIKVKEPNFPGVIPDRRNLAPQLQQPVGLPTKTEPGVSDGAVEQKPSFQLKPEQKWRTGIPGSAYMPTGGRPYTPEQMALLQSGGKAYPGGDVTKITKPEKIGWDSKTGDIYKPGEVIGIGQPPLKGETGDTPDPRSELREKMMGLANIITTIANKSSQSQSDVRQANAAHMALTELRGIYTADQPTYHGMGIGQKGVAFDPKTGKTSETGINTFDELEKKIFNTNQQKGFALYSKEYNDFKKQQAKLWEDQVIKTGGPTKENSQAVADWNEQYYTSQGIPSEIASIGKWTNYENAKSDQNYYWRKEKGRDMNPEEEKKFKRDFKLIREKTIPSIAQKYWGSKRDAYTTQQPIGLSQFTQTQE